MNNRTFWRRAAYAMSFLTVAGVAAINSYAHMRDVALLGHQPAPLASILPLSVDGMLVIASLAMAEDKAHQRRPRPWARFAFWLGALVSISANIASTAVHYGDPLSIGVAAWSPIALLVVVEIMARPGRAIALTPHAPAAAETAALEKAYRMPSAPVSPAPSEDPRALAFRAAMKRKRPVAA